MNNFVKSLIMFSIVAALGAIVFYLYRIEKVKKEGLVEYQNMVVLLEKYKPSTVSTTLQTDDKFMKVLISKLSSDKDFLAAVAKEVKTK
jgi:hypothetical protein